MTKEVEIIKQRLNTIRKNTKVGNSRIADEENESCIKCIETCLSDIEKSLIALEIIKEKGVDLWSLKHLDDEDYLEQYNALANIEKPYTKEEYWLLEEVLL